MNESVPSDPGAARDPDVAAVIARPWSEPPLPIPVAGRRPSRKQTWTSIGITLAALGMALALQFAVGVVLGIVAGIVTGPRGSAAVSQALSEFFRSGPGILLLLMLGQAGYAIVARLVRPWPGQSRRQHAGLVSAGLRWWHYVTFLAGTICCAGIGTLLSGVLESFWPTAGESHLRETWASLDPRLAVAWVLGIALAPGFFEEILFRGIVQRRLLATRGPLWAISVSSLLFALSHLAPTTIVFALPIGVFLGVIAWRAGSIYPTIFCHAGLNGLWNIYFIATTRLDWSAERAGIVMMASAAVCAIGLAASVVIVVRLRPSPSPDPAFQALSAPG